MIVIVPTKKLKELLPQGLLTSEDSLLICQRNAEGEIVFTEFRQYCKLTERTNVRTDKINSDIDRGNSKTMFTP